MLRGLNFKSVYKSDQDNILEEFYIPALSIATKYDRAVGFFSASTFNYAAQALSAFVKHSGAIRLILGAFSDKEDIEAVSKGYRLREISEVVGEELLNILTNVGDELFQNRLEALSWLVAHGRLEIKIALREKGMFHDKVGIIEDESTDSIVFTGSANESAYALLPTHNYESINVFPSWRPELKEYYLPHLESFERLWANESANTAVIDIPTAVKERLLVVARSMSYTPDPEIEAAIWARLQNKAQVGASIGSALPREPKTINGQPFEMHRHQIAALEAWKAKGDFQGIFDLATGAGKTITAIHAIVKLAERIQNLTCVIAVPYQNLADQWCDILSASNIYPIRCYVARSNWIEGLRTAVHEVVMGSRRFTAIVVVNRTLKSTDFQECLAQIKGNRLLWIGDECHHHASEAFEGYLPGQARYRIGLSATPEHYLDDRRNERLSEFYGEIVYHYPLKQAIADKVLTPYHYYPYIVRLIDIEAEEFIELSEEIGKNYAQQKQAGSTQVSQQLTALLMRRARLIGSASNKLPALSAALEGQIPIQHTLFYCGDGSVESEEDRETEEEIIFSRRQIEVVSSLLHEKGWDVSRFTSRESRKERDTILDNFRIGVIDAMVAIRCLDEGIDVPACSTAYILASSRDPRQFIQRRGRILRRYPGKTIANIHDFVVILPENFKDEGEYARRLVRSELRRVAEFAGLSENRHEAYERLRPTLNYYDLEHLL